MRPTLVVTAFLVTTLSTAAAQRPNILWLVAEDLGPELGCYGTKEVWTPNLDRLAGEGVRYTHCYNGHVCSPSRSGFMTGMYPITNATTYINNEII